MATQYSIPMTNAWRRMKQALFHPFSLGKWLAVGFCAFLASMTEGGGGGGWNWLSNRSQNGDLESLLHAPEELLMWLQDHPLWAGLLMAILAVSVVVLVVLTWVSARGKFMFLDNVVHDRAEIAAPWREYRREGNGLFGLELIIGLIGLAVIAFFLYEVFLLCYGAYEEYGSLESVVQPLILWALAGMVVLPIFLFIHFLLGAILVPVMYKFRVGAGEGIRKTLHLLSKELVSYVVFGLLVLALGLVMVIAIVLIGCMTCCIGFLLMAIPYVGSVVLLPMTYFFRAFTAEFIGQFGEDYQLFPRPQQEPPPPADDVIVLR